MAKGLVLSLIAISLLAFASNVENYYKIDAEVVSSKDGYITVIDETNEVWSLYAEGLQEKDTISIKFDENHTTNRIDDIIVDYEKP